MATAFVHVQNFLISFLPLCIDLHLEYYFALNDQIDRLRHLPLPIDLFIASVVFEFNVGEDGVNLLPD